ncbi:hypothetical protein FK268_09180 [Tsukamurella sputi]|uniref:Uncharacterized protein n=1 Tax=Tsukamurella sputi TaxID=2591848 RepID=A0A5C5RRM7_9ACTN|nr:hypothetical protein [Tsukamurella sputi]TWS25354.1 hypothetical protein FK268_09180 [Tsukamurella sputi]
MENFKYSYRGMGEVLRSTKVEVLTRMTGLRALGFYQSIVAHRTGQLAASARVVMSKGSNGRPVATLAVGGDDAVYGLAHEFGFDDGDSNIQAAHHDLLTVLGMLR